MAPARPSTISWGHDKVKERISSGSNCEDSFCSFQQSQRELRAVKMKKSNKNCKERAIPNVPECQLTTTAPLLTIRFFNF